MKKLNLILSLLPVLVVWACNEPSFRDKEVVPGRYVQADVRCEIETDDPRVGDDVKILVFSDVALDDLKQSITIGDQVVQSDLVEAEGGYRLVGDEENLFTTEAEGEHSIAITAEGYHGVLTNCAFVVAPKIDFVRPKPPQIEIPPPPPFPPMCKPEQQVIGRKFLVMLDVSGSQHNNDCTDFDEYEENKYRCNVETGRERAVMGMFDQIFALSEEFPSDDSVSEISIVTFPERDGLVHTFEVKAENREALKDKLAELAREMHGWTYLNDAFKASKDYEAEITFVISDGLPTPPDPAAVRNAAEERKQDDGEIIYQMLVLSGQTFEDISGESYDRGLESRLKTVNPTPTPEEIAAHNEAARALYHQIASKQDLSCEGDECAKREFQPEDTEKLAEELSNLVSHHVSCETDDHLF